MIPGGPWHSHLRRFASARRKTSLRNSAVRPSWKAGTESRSICASRHDEKTRHLLRTQLMPSPQLSSYITLYRSTYINLHQLISTKINLLTYQHLSNRFSLSAFATCLPTMPESSWRVQSLRSYRLDAFDTGNSASRGGFVAWKISFPSFSALTWRFQNRVSRCVFYSPSMQWQDLQYRHWWRWSW